LYSKDLLSMITSMKMYDQKTRDIYYAKYYGVDGGKVKNENEDSGGKI